MYEKSSTPYVLSIVIILTKFTQTSKSNGPIAVFRCKMAFLKSKFKDDPVRVQRHTVPHFKDLE